MDPRLHGDAAHGTEIYKKLRGLRGKKIFNYRDKQRAQRKNSVYLCALCS